MSLQSSVPLRDGAKANEGEQPLPSENSAHGGRFKSIGGVSATRKTTDVAPTRRQLEILRFIAGNLASVGRPPTYREICARFHLASTNAANDHVKALLRKGLLAKSRMKARGFVLTEAGLRAIGSARHLCRFCGQSLPGSLHAADSSWAQPPSQPPLSPAPKPRTPDISRARQPEQALNAGAAS